MALTWYCKKLPVAGTQLSPIVSAPAAGHSSPTGTVERGRSDTDELSLPICDLQKSFSFNMTLNSIVTQAFRVISKHIVANTRYTFGGTRVIKDSNSRRHVQRHSKSLILSPCDYDILLVFVCAYISVLYCFLFIVT